jgi:hypothetical protein
MVETDSVAVVSVLGETVLVVSLAIDDTISTPSSRNATTIDWTKPHSVLFLHSRVIGEASVDWTVHLCSRSRSRSRKDDLSWDFDVVVLVLVVVRVSRDDRASVLARGTRFVECCCFEAWFLLLVRGRLRVGVEASSAHPSVADENLDE